MSIKIEVDLVRDSFDAGRAFNENFISLKDGSGFPASTEKPLIEKPVCAECGSTDIVVDAFAEWSVESQAWVLHSTYDYTHCNDCDGECRVEWMTMTESGGREAKA